MVPFILLATVLVGANGPKGKAIDRSNVVGYLYE
jgi:hypothetical protein